MFDVRLCCRLSLVTLVLILAAIMLVGCVRRVVSVAEMDKIIRDQVPVGSDKQRVKDFIDNLKINSLRIIRDDFHQASPQALGNRDPEKIAELGDRIAEFVSAVVVDAQSGFLYHDNLVIQFYIDKDGRLIGYTVKMDGAE